METYFKKIIKDIGEDTERDGLKDTPKRASKAIKFLTKGYTDCVENIVNNALFNSDNDEMIIVKDIELYSLCEHHMLPFIGKCHVAYIPSGKIIGLSKIARLVDMFARRLQVQERLTKEIAETLMTVTKAKGVGVVIEAKHLCMMMRGVEKQNSVMTTSVMVGNFKSDNCNRAEFLGLIKQSS
ncbi:GTP cyclohydrolase I FolE [Gammaproteobacteria bacterium]|nr:GTP cyclohydrolase I FolE [Gammaproteobacteria bacterium]